MRKQLITSMLCALSLLASAQGEYDALKYSQGDLLGTARYMGMAGAFGALGGDMSAIHQNPAGIGIYRSSELSLTPVFSMSGVKSVYDGTSANNDKMSVQLNSFGYVGSFRPSNNSNVSNINFAITYNRIKDYNRVVGLRSFNKPTSMLDMIASSSGKINPDNLNGLSYLSWETFLINRETDGYYSPALIQGETVDPTMYMKEEGGIGELDLTLGANWAHFMYLGLGVGFQSIDYSMASSYEESTPGITGVTDPMSFELRNALSTTGSGVNVKIGAIIKPFSFLRFGFALHSPTYYTLTDAFGTDMTSWGVSDQSYEDSERFTEETASYELTVPGKITYSMAYLFGKKGLLSFDCDVLDYREMALKDVNGLPYDSENTSINNHMQTVYNLRFGGEYRVTDNLSLRAGTAWYGSAYKDNMTAANPAIETAGTVTQYAFDKGSRYYTGGFGYRSGSFFMDFAVTNQQQKENIFPYYDQPINGENRTDNRYASVTTNRMNVVLSTGFRF
ncbi:MAG: hypothetical protein GXY09_06955 [Bacteroidales bacterium]|nr:hypothetical protein [Bacteroidales bacterium]